MRVVLIVEDEILEQEFLKSIVMDLLMPDDRVLTCESGSHAVKLAKEHQPDIIIMDIRIPELDGIAAIQEIRNFLPQACISVLSAYSDFTYAQKAISLRVFEYLLKPVKPADFTQVFQRMLNSIAQSPGDTEDTTDVNILQGSGDHQYFIEEAVKYINEHFKEKLTLEMVASKVFVNPKYFSHVFKKELGISFTEYIINLRIQHACRLLKTTNYPAYRVSFECGFSDPSYFNRVFSNHMKMTPQAYRKSKLKE